MRPAVYLSRQTGKRPAGSQQTIEAADLAARQSSAMERGRRDGAQDSQRCELPPPRTETRLHGRLDDRLSRGMGRP